MRRIVLSLAFLTLAACAHAPASPPQAAACQAPAYAPDEALAPQIDAIVDQAVAEGFAGQIVLMREGAIVYRRAAGHADLAGRVPVTDETLFHVASISKYFTAALTLAAAEDGLIALEAPAAHYLPGPAPGPAGVTIADLLAHRSGLGSSYAAEAHNETVTALGAIEAAGFDAARAGGFRYSNDGYDVLGIMLEHVYGRRYEAAARARLFAPACITHAGFWGETDLTNPLIVGQPLRTPDAALRQRNYGMLGSAGLLITASELAAWQHALTSGRVLSQASRRELFAPRGAIDLGRVTYGAFLVERPGLMGWTPPNGIDVPKWRCYRTT